jgi:TolA-binding protein
MNTNLKALAALVLAASVGFGYAQSTAGSTSSKSSKTHKKTVAKKPSIESQIEALRNDLNSQRNQIETLKQQLSERDAQLQQAQQSAQSAQQAAQAAQRATNQEQQQVTENASTVSTLQNSVNDLKTNTTSIVGTIQDEQVSVRKAIEAPDTIHYKGITISPAGSFIEAATVNRTSATGGDINTAFTGTPLNHSNAAQISEFFGSARQSRLALKASGKLSNMTLTGYYEMDWLGTGITSNNNQSNSYVVRQRQLWAQAAMNSGWTFTGGQMWSLATETTQGMSNGSEILPSTIDPQYNAGFVWERQYGFRVTKDFDEKFWLGASVENPETLNPAGSNLPTNLLIGTAGTGGGLYNPTANYSFNLAPDIIAKAVWEPGWGHYEVFGVGRFFRARIYPNATSSAGAFNDSTVAGGVGGGLRVPALNKKLTIALKGLWGQGVGRYGSSTIADITLRPNGQIAPLHAFSALGTVEANPTSRLTIYLNYGGDYVFRRYFGNIGYGSPLTNMSGCGVEPPVPTNTAGFATADPATPGNCGGNNKAVQEISTGYWYNFYNGPKGRLRQGLQYSYFRRDLWSGNGGTANPGGGATGSNNVVETSLRYYLP